MGSSVRGHALGLCGAALSLGLCALGGCDDDPAMRDAGVRGQGTSKPDARALPDSGAERVLDGACEGNQPLAQAELQGRATGSSVYGRVISGEGGSFDPNGMRECGLAGVKICVMESGDCIESDRAGQFVMNGLPQGIAAQVTFEAPSFRSALRLVQLAATPVDLFETRMLTQTSANRLLEHAGAEADPKLAAMVAVALAASEAIGGVTIAGDVAIALEPGGVAPLYSIGELEGSGLSSDELDPTLTATRPGGWGLFVGQQAGEYSVHFERGGVQCAPFVAGYGHGIDEQGNVKAVLRAGFTTTVGAFCP
jgi:hypothetical protein